MDWPIIGAVSAVTIAAGVVIFEVVIFTQSGPASIKRAPQLASYGSSVERSVYDIPGFAAGRPTEWQPSFPLIRLIDPDPTPQAKGPFPAGSAPTPGGSKKSSATSVPATSTSLATKPSSSVDQRPTPPPSVTSQPTSDSSPRVEQWRVIVTAQASYFNLGGHVDKAGIVDSLASSHLRDALKSHRNFPQLPADVRTHILTQNINLTKVAPYRGLLGMNDKTLEEEQAIRFERIASR
jgi:hypothetical protein